MTNRYKVCANKDAPYKKQTRYALWIPSKTGKHYKTFDTLDEAHLYLIKFGGGLEIIKEVLENF